MTSHRDLVIPGTGEFVLQTGLPYALNFAILAVGGAEAFAGYRLAQLIFAAVGNLAVGLNAVSLPRLVGARRPRQALQDVRNEFWLLTGLVAVLTLVMFLIPLDLGREVFGANWVAMVPFLAACAVHGWANSVAVPVVALIRLLGLAMYSLWIRMGTVVATIVGVAAVASWGGPQAFAWALALPAVGGFLARFLRVRAELRRLVLEDRLIP